MGSFQKAMRLINSENRSSMISSILSGIRKLASMSPSNPSAKWRELQSLGEGLRRRKDSTHKERPLVAKIVEEIRDIASGLVPELQMVEGTPDLFTASEEQWRREIDEALPPDFADFDEGFENASIESELEPELVTAARKEQGPLRVLDSIILCCDEFLRSRPESAEARKNLIRQYYRSGVDGLGWYDSVNDMLVRYFGKRNARTFAMLLAATSPRTSVERNLENAIRAFSMYARDFHGRPPVDDPDFKGRMSRYFMRTHVPNIGRAMNGTDLSGPKVSNFARALSGDPDAVTLDVWMARALGARSKILDDQASYEAIADAIRELAAEEGVEPRQYQAAVWTGIKKSEGKKGQTAASFDALMGKFWGDFAKECFRPSARIPPSTNKYPLLGSWISKNCKFSSTLRLRRPS